MCTLSWLATADGISIFFNRDEAKIRSKALPPKVHYSHQGHSYIMPVDAQSHGSWIGVTETGFAICLLNFYQGKTPNGRLISRGLLVKDLLECKDHHHIDAYLNSKNWSLYAPFTLVIFITNNKEPNTYCWDGERFSQITITSPYTSSGVDFPEVSAARQMTFAQFFTLNEVDTEQEKATKLRNFHTSHIPEKSKFSVCMHREDASTVSFSEINITATNVSLDYIDGSPCEGQKIPRQSLVRTA